MCRGETVLRLMNGRLVRRGSGERIGVSVWGVSAIGREAPVRVEPHPTRRHLPGALPFYRLHAAFLDRRGGGR